LKDQILFRIRYCWYAHDSRQLKWHADKL